MTMAMDTLRWLLLIVVLTLIRVGDAANRSYRAAVVQMAPRGSINATAGDNLRLGLAALDMLASTASKNGAEIVVFPEAVLWDAGLVAHRGRSARENVKEYGEQVPRIGAVPCTPTHTRSPSSGPDISVVDTASCIAAKYGIVLVVNTIDIQPCTSGNEATCPPDGHRQLNTDVVFDGTKGGEIVAVYHKYHLYYTAPALDPPPKPEVVSFVAPFGVRFGVIICFDAEFNNPLLELLSGADPVNHVIFSTSWFNSPPLYVATMFQQALSRRHGVTMLAANTGSSGMSSGSGIYVAGEPRVVHFDPNEVAVDKVLIANVPINRAPRSQQILPTFTGTTGSVMHSTSTACEYTTPSLVPNGQCADFSSDVFRQEGATRSISVDDFSCSATVVGRKGSPTSALEDEPGSYTLFASSGSIGFGSSGSMNVKTCGVIYCQYSSVARHNQTRICRGVYDGNMTVSRVSVQASMDASANIFGMASVGENASLLGAEAFKFNTNFSKMEVNPASSMPLFSAVLYGLLDHTH